MFPNMKDRLKTKTKVTLKITEMVTAHGKTRSYLHRFKIIEPQNAPASTESKRRTTYCMTAAK